MTAILFRAWILFLLVFSGSTMGQSAGPQWIWVGVPDQNQPSTTLIRKKFQTPPLTWNSRLTLAADDRAEVFLNGQLIGICHGPQQPMRTEVTVRLNQGENVIAVRASNQTGPAGVLVNLDLGGKTNVWSDESWLASGTEEPGWTNLNFNAAGWKPARVLAAHGSKPWGEVLDLASATSPGSISVPTGFKVELLRSALPGEGSWVCMAFDPSGRLIVSPQGEKYRLLRFDLKGGGVERVENFAPSLRFAMGLLFFHGNLYANARGPEGNGLYLLRDLNKNDQFETNECRLLKKFEGGSEHGYHAIRLGSDQKIYVLNGNGTKVPNGISPRSPYRNYGEDVLSLNPDEGEKSPTPVPAGYVLRTDPEGREWELWLGGLRNSYDFDFNREGELFIFDSDMEWDWGTPWYRPTRLMHGVSGADFGWREGTRLWPDYYEDSLPGVADVGIGSPTGVAFGGRSKFPVRYRSAMFGCDWSYGRIFSIQLKHDGASYRGEVETFLRGTPLNLTDIEFGPEGAMYFITGGRGTQSGLYRVTYTGPEDQASKETVVEPEITRIRRRLEKFHGLQDVSSIEEIWPQLGNPDRFVRHTARVALEFQDFALWREKSLAETNSLAGLTSLLAMARVGPAETQPALLKALAKYPLDGLDEAQTLLKLRVIQLSFLRQGRPSQNLIDLAVQKLDRKYPSGSWPVNRELSRLLIYLEAPGVVEKTLALLNTAPSLEEQFHYVAQLRGLRSGWTMEQRRRYFSWWLQPREQLKHMLGFDSWFADVGRTYVDGAFVDKYLRDFRTEAVAGLTEMERRELAPLLARPFEKARLIPSNHRTFVRGWKMEDFAGDFDKLSKGRNFAQGRQAMVDGQCLACHRFGNDGGATGPELAGAGSKYDARSLLESMLEPSKVINEQYVLTGVEFQNGETLTGRIIVSSGDLLVLETDAIHGTRESIPRSKVKSMEPLKTSPMPEGLLDIFSREEILDLLAYLQSGGRADAAAFLPR